MRLPDGIVAVVKRDCPTCVLVEPVLRQLDAATALTVFSQDDPAFPSGVSRVVDDTSLETSWHLDLVSVPTLLKVRDGTVVDRVEGWLRPDWERLTGVHELGIELPEYRPGCGSRTLDADVVDELRVRFSGSTLHARRVELAALDDDMEIAYDRGWSDGLPVVPPTEARVLRMLEGTVRDPQDVVAVVPPDLVECTVEKVAINAVMAGCLPEYLPVVLAAVEVACTDEFNMHGLLATTYFSGPVVVVNGPIARALGMNSGINAFGPGNRANATIGRALQLVVRNVGGGVPGRVDRATLGNPGKYTFCFAEDEAGSPWEPLAVSRGVAAGASAVTLFAAAGVQPLIDQASRRPESLARSFAAALQVNPHPKLTWVFDAMVVVSPEHARVFAEAGWSRDRLVDELRELTTLPGEQLVRGAGGIDEGMPEQVADGPVQKFRDGGLLVVHAGGRAGMFSAILGGWINGIQGGSDPVTREVT